MLEDNTGVPAYMIRTAVGYGADYPDQVEALMAHAGRTEADAMAAASRTTALLSR